MTVAGWPAFTLPISDSLRATTSCIELRSLSTANEELEEPEEELDDLEALDEPVVAPPAAEAPPVADAPVPDPLVEELLLEALVVPPPDTVSPT